MTVNNKLGKSEEKGFSVPVISLPKGGGAIRSIGEKFGASPVSGTGSMKIPIPTSPGRSGFNPQLSLTYDSGTGNGPFGFGWSLSLPSISRRTDKGLPRYNDTNESDVFIMSGTEDLVPVLARNGNGQWIPVPVPTQTLNGATYQIQLFRPRIEGSFARIERWTNVADTRDIIWRAISKDNITSWYGKSEEHRIAGPEDPHCIFSWLICESYDDRGNAILYEYAPEDSDGIDLLRSHEKNRTNTGRSANRYIKRIKYGNTESRLAEPDLSQMSWLFEVVFDYDEGHYDALPTDSSDYLLVRANRNRTRNWSVREDPFSTYRASFEIRTYRLCQRVLMFHHFPDELGADDCLVRSMEFDYDRNALASFITGITESGYVRRPDGTYIKKSLPPLEFQYSEATIHNEVRVIDAESLQNLPYGLDNGRYKWLDLDGEGLSGILTEQDDGWYYKHNLSPVNSRAEDGKVVLLAQFGPLEQVATRPSFKNAGSGLYQFLDLAGDGQLDLVDFQSPIPGFFERNRKEGWESFKPFVSFPVLDWGDPNLNFVDLTGDGHADILITEDDAFTWYPSLAEGGFAESERIRQALDEESGPRLVFAGGTQTIHLADMSGDGLTDLVRIRNGEVCYWPNMGYGRFGAKITMDNSPWFDAPDQFNQDLVRIADIDGSGVSDIIYLAHGGVRLYFNQSGNSWSDARALSGFPPVDNLTSVQAVDLHGNGTACLVWSSPLPDKINNPMCYMDLMGGQKPHLLIKSDNNSGAETHVRYAPSTKFYITDKMAGKPWITKLPFPVHVVEQIDTYDRISGNRLTTRYAYHHGYYDGIEREFRGFGMVEQMDTEEFSSLSADGQPAGATNIDESSHVPPAITRTWHHTGAYLGRERISNYFAGTIDGKDPGEYYREPGLTDSEAEDLLLDDTVLPEGLNVEEEREACRALKGLMLRQEVYASDGSEEEKHPYIVKEQNFTIRCLQPRSVNHSAVFFTHVSESVNYHYERNPSDPRTTHNLTLEADDFGNVLKSAAIGYGRRRNVFVADDHGGRQEIPNPGLSKLDPQDQEKQTATFITYTENGYTNAIDGVNDHRTPLISESRTYELTGYTTSGNAGRFKSSDFVSRTSNGFEHTFDSEIKYEEKPGNGRQRRLIEHVRTVYRSNNLTGPLPLGEIESRAVPYESYKLAFTLGLAQQVFVNSGKITSAELSNVLEGEGKYVHSEGNSDWWIPRGRTYYSPDAADGPSQELEFAIEHFFLPHRYTDPFEQTSTVTFDNHNLLAVETRDALANTVTAGERDELGNSISSGNDYRVLGPVLVTDPNGNRTAVSYDALGMAVGTAVMGKRGESPRHGDLLDGFIPDLPDDVIAAHLSDPLADPHAILGRAGTRTVFDLSAYHRTKGQTNPSPAVVYKMARETHDADLQPGEQTKIQHSFSYIDGFGRVIQRKIQAEPGEVEAEDTDGNVTIVDTGPNIRWVGSEWIIYNNKGKPVRQYKPFFSTHQNFQFGEIAGVSPIIFYDPLGRTVSTLHPNHTWEKVIFSPWEMETWDVNDTILAADPGTDEDVGDFFRRLADEEYLPTWYQQRQSGDLGPEEKSASLKTAAHAETPSAAYTDPLGRVFLTVAHNKFRFGDSSPADPTAEELYKTRFILDIEGNQLRVIDAMERIVVEHDYDMAGNQIHNADMESGERWVLTDVNEKPVYTWDSRGHRFRTTYDPLRRPVETFMREGAGQERLIGRTVYGEGMPDAVEKNQRGKVVEFYDQAGVVKSEEYDFKGNVLLSRRLLAKAYDSTIDWSDTVPLEQEAYSSRIRFDAINRITEMVAPDDSVIRRAYNEANLLERLDVNLRGERLNGEPVWTSFIAAVDYDANGRRARIDYGNGVSTAYRYDKNTVRLVHKLTQRDKNSFPDDCPQPPATGWEGCQVQNLHYTFDPMGNITHIRDDAQQTLYFRNKRVDPSSEYSYDALYQLIEAAGREHLGQLGAEPQPGSYNDSRRTGVLFSASDGNAMGRYIERYVYDPAGNFVQMKHQGRDPVIPGWTRTFAYDEPSMIEPAKHSNRLSSATIGPVTEKFSEAGDGYDEHGNMLRMPHLQIMQWDFKDQLRMTRRQAVNMEDSEGQEHQGERTWYVYDAHGQRVRKVTEQAAGVIKYERIYLSGFEIYRKPGSNPLVRETLHVMDGKQRIALVETRTSGNDGSDRRLIRYQFGNHQGSSVVELDETAQIISYEEYTPFGSTSYQAVRSHTEGAKRYRFTRMERDEESGLYYNTIRYYAPWLCRWTAADPIGIGDGVNLYRYCNNNPVNFVDRNGLESKQQRWEKEFDKTIPQYKDIDVTVGTFDDGVMTPMGIRVPIYKGDYLTPRKFYERKEAAMAAYQGFIHYAELLEAGFDAAAFTMSCARFRNCAPIPDTELDLAAFAHWSYNAKLARDGVMMATGAMQSAAFSSAALKTAQADAALLRAASTEMNARNLENITRATTTATGEETFYHTTMRVEGAHTPQTAALNIEQTKSITMSPGGQVGQFGTGAYAYEGTMPANSKAVMVQFNVAPGTAIERISIPGEKTIVRLVPGEGNAVTIMNPVTNLTPAETKEAMEWLNQIKKLIK